MSVVIVKNLRYMELFIGRALDYKYLILEVGKFQVKVMQLCKIFNKIIICINQENRLCIYGVWSCKLSSWKWLVFSCIGDYLVFFVKYYKKIILGKNWLVFKRILNVNEFRE